jgi:tetratricopeptide (TPR) repeat protein
VLIWVAAAVIVLGASLGALYLRQHRRQTRLDLPARIAAARSSLDQKQYDQAIELAQGILSARPDDSQARAILDEAQKQKRQATIDILMVEAQNLRSQNQLEESHRTIDKVLEIDPAYQPALAVQSQLEAEISASKSKEEQDKEIQGWLARADSLLTAGKLAEAKIEVDKVESLRPDAPELPALRNRLGAKTAELGRSQKADLEAAQKRKMAGELGSKAEELFRQGKYTEVQSVVDRLLVETPQNARAQSLRTLANDALATMRIYEAAFAAKDYSAALGAVSRLEKINPSDSNIAELRKRAEASKAAAKATLSIYRLGEPGVLTLDDQRVGTEGEVENKVVSAGRHRLQVKGATGKLNTFEYEFLDGQNLTFVYDSTAAELRLFTPSDRDAIARRKQREETRRFPVEHLHGFLKGKCTGDLLVNGIQVEYKPAEGDHHFLIPFQNLKLVVKDEKLEFTETPGGRQLQFKPRDARQAGIIKRYWDSLEKLGK